MKLANQVKILKAHGFRFKRIIGWHKKYIQFESPEGTWFSLKKSDTKASLEGRIGMILRNDQMKAEWRETQIKEIKAHWRRKSFRVLTGGAPWFKSGDYRAKLTVIKGEAA